MGKTAVFIRCTEYNKQVKRLIVELETLGDSVQIYAVPDQIGENPAGDTAPFAEINVPVLPITSAFIEDSGLHLFNDASRTGWACGDYVIYRGLEVETWDFAWVIEPDVYFLNGSVSLLKRAIEEDAGLIATNLWKAPESWYWHKPLKRLVPQLDIHAMSFPLVRVSRDLAEDALELRKTITPLLGSNKHVPNDESVVASAAALHGYTTIDLRKELPDEFRFWATTVKFPAADIGATHNDPLVVHSGLEPQEFIDYSTRVWHSDKRAEQVANRRRLLEAIEPATAPTLRALIRALSKAD